MRKTDRLKLQTWAIAYASSPDNNPSASPPQALAIKIHTLMSDGKWRTATAIADELSASVYAVRDVMWCIKCAWGYEANKSRSKGYRRM